MTIILILLNCTIMGPRLSIMGPRHNITHTTGPSADELKNVITHSKPLVIEHTKQNGEVYYPVFLPFNARIVCPYCRKECSIGTYPSHVTGDRRCHEYRRIEEQSKIVLQPTQEVPPPAVSTTAPVPAAHITNPPLVPSLNAEKPTPDNQAMFAMFLQFTEFIKNNGTANKNTHREQQDGPGKSQYLWFEVFLTHQLHSPDPLHSLTSE